VQLLEELEPSLPRVAVESLEEPLGLEVDVGDR
jgi:hypothetical protein